MIARAASSPREQRQLSGARLRWFASIVFCGVLPVLTLVVFYAAAIEDDAVAMDFQQFYWAADVILRGEDPYPLEGVPQTVWGGPYPYPPLPALVSIPMTLLSLKTAGLVVMTGLVVIALSIPFVLGVRDWRCYGMTLLWPPVLSAIQTGNLTLPLALGAALAWRLRDRTAASSAVIGVGLAAKFFLWPLAVWLAATRRVTSALLACAIGGFVLVVSWAVIGFAGLLDYPERLRRLDEVVGADSYTVYILAQDLGVPDVLARAIWLGLGFTLLAATVVTGRRGAERSAFILAIATSLALTPIIWLHYFALLLVVVALAQPRLGVAWFVPLGMVVTPGSGHPTFLETSATLLVAAATFFVALRATGALPSMPLTRSRAPRPVAGS